MKLKIVLIKEVDTVEKGQLLYDMVKTAVAPKEPIDKSAKVTNDTVLE